MNSIHTFDIESTDLVALIDERNPELLVGRNARPTDPDQRIAGTEFVDQLIYAAAVAHANGECDCHEPGDITESVWMADLDDQRAYFEAAAAWRAAEISVTLDEQ